MLEEGGERDAEGGFGVDSGVDVLACQKKGRLGWFVQGFVLLRGLCSATMGH